MHGKPCLFTKSTTILEPYTHPCLVIAAYIIKSFRRCIAKPDLPNLFNYST